MVTERAPARQILRYGDARLREICRPVAPDEDVTDLADRLWRALDEAGGVGLAAPQIGDLRRVIAVRPPRRAGAQRLILVNPTLDATAGPGVPFEEGCLSFPGLYTRIWRPRSAVVTYRDPAGEPARIEDDGIIARIVQHEIDHLDGVLFIDRLPAWRRWLLAGRLALVRVSR